MDDTERRTEAVRRCMQEWLDASILAVLEGKRLVFTYADAELLMKVVDEGS